MKTTLLPLRDHDEDDLAIGVPYENIGSIADAGAVNVIYGHGSAVALGGGNLHQFWHQDVTNIEDVAETGDRFGVRAAVGNFNGDIYVTPYYAFNDLAIGVYLEDVGSIVNAGAVSVIYGSSAALSATSVVPNQLWHQNSTARLAGDTTEVATAPEAALGVELPLAFALEPAAPNPSAGTTRIAFALPEAAPVRLTVYDALGREVARPVDAEQPAGRHVVMFEGDVLPAGVYVVRLTAGAFSASTRVLLLR